MLEIPWEMWEDRNEYFHHFNHPWIQQDKQQLNIDIQEIYKDFDQEEYLKETSNYFLHQ